MILPFHIVVALLSLVFTGLAFFKPSKPKLEISYALVILTLISGFTLVVSKPANLTQTCITGLAYLAIVLFGIISARQKLKSQI